MINDYEIRGNITAIFLKRKGRIIETLIDTCDLEKAKTFKLTWFAHWSNITKSYYVNGHNHIGRHTTVHLHRFLTDCPAGMEVDHMNHDTLDNRRSANLKIVTKSFNQQNRKGPTRANTSGYRGVSFKKATGKWRANITINKKQIHLGYFLDKIEANQVVVNARKSYMDCSYADRVPHEN